MRIAIASEGKDMTSNVSEVSGRAPFYLIFDDDKLVEVVKNPFAVGGGGAGWGVAKMLKDKNVDLVVSGKFGDNMLSSLSEKKVKSLVMPSIPVKDALVKAKAKKE